MAVFKCKMCGGALELNENLSVGACPYCGTQQTFPKVDDEKKLALFNRANNLRFKSEFDKAACIYESIVSEFPDEAEAYWGLVLCKYGIEYVDDKDGSKIPTCHRTLPTSIMKDEDFQQACENADISAKMLYRDEAKAIDGIQKKILEIASTEEPYDIFICYKETDDATGTRTEDSSIAQDIYTALTEMDYKVFYARNSLRKVAGTEYEPYIYSALSSAKVMLAIGTKYEYYDAVWVKNEWNRYLSMMADDKTKHLIPCFKNMDAYDIPEEFSNMQALDMADMMFFNSLETSVKRALPLKTKIIATEVPVVNAGAVATVDSLLKRAFMFLEDGNFARADEFCEQVLNIDPENAQAYLYKFMVEMRVNKQEQIVNSLQPLNTYKNFDKALRFAGQQQKAVLLRYADKVQYSFNERKYRNALSIISDKNATKRNFAEAAEIFNSLVGFKDSNEQRVFCLKKIEEFTSAEKLAKEKTFRQKKKKKVKLTFLAVILVSFFSALLIGAIVFSFSIDAAYSFNNADKIILMDDGSLVATGEYASGEWYDVSGWTDIIELSANDEKVVGLKSDGTVVAVGETVYGQCDVEGWTDIIAVSAGLSHTVGLKSDGTVVAVGDTASGRCDVGEWTDIVAVSAGFEHTVGLKSDGTVVATQYNSYDYAGQCDVSGWTDIIAISAGDCHTVGLKADGTVVAVGENYDGRCDVENWTDIVAIATGSDHTVGLKSDGTVVAVGESYGECDVKRWTDVVSVFANSYDTIGVTSDGTIVWAGSDRKYDCDDYKTEDIVSIHFGNIIYG